MIVLPIVGRELRVAARRAGTYRTRLWAAFGAILLAGWKGVDLIWRGGSSASQGQSLFYTLSGLAFVYCLCIGARVTSDCLSEEKRDGTLGLLFLTDLKGLDVVFGKLVASSLNSFYGLLGVFPVLALPLLMGGVSPEQFGRMVVVLLNALFFSLSLGMFVSAISRNERKAIFATLVGVLVPALLPFCLVLFMITVLEWVQDWAGVVQLLPLLVFNPIYPFLVSLPLPFLTTIPLPAWSFWASVGVIHVLSWVLLLVTAVILPTVWKDRPRVITERKRGPGLMDRWRLWAQGSTAQRKALRDQLLERSPFLWLVSRDRLKPGYAWFFLFAMICVWLWGYWDYGSVMFDFYPLVPTVFMIHCFLKVWVVTEVSHRMVEDQRNGAMELLLSTPMTVKEILRGQQMAILRQFTWPILAMGVVEVLTFKSAVPVRLILPVLIILVADLYTLMWLSMRWSMTAKSVNEVLLKSLLAVLVMPWIIYFVAWPFWQSGWRSLHLGSWRLGFSHRVYFWFVIALLTNLFLILRWGRPFVLERCRQTALRGWLALRDLVQRGRAGGLRTE